MESKQNYQSRGRRSQGRRSRRPRTRQLPGDPLSERTPFSGSGSNNPVLSLRSIPLFGLRTRRRLRYCETITLTGGASVVGSYVFSANGLYDPNISGTGHQPMGFDQMMVCYNHYTVLGARATATFTNLAAALTAHVGLSVSGSTAVTTDYNELLENGQIVYGVINPPLAMGQCVVLRTSVDTAAFQGIKTAVDDPDMRGDSASNPAEQQYFILTIWYPAGANVPSASVDFQIEYDVIFHEPKKITLS